MNRSNQSVPMPLSLSGFMNGNWKEQTYQSFRDGIDICVLREAYPRVALLKYIPGSSVPAHRHTGLELIQVLEGSQSDENGTYTTGDMVLNPAGSRHSVWSDDGCVVLILWERPIEFEAQP